MTTDITEANQLTIEEHNALIEHEETIERGLGTFIDVGVSLLAIRDQRLYRLTHSSFQAYCGERWGFSRSRAHRLIEAAAVAKNLLPIGNTPPTNEAQVRPLTGLEPEEQRRVWKTVTETAPEGKVTAAYVKIVIDGETGRAQATPGDRPYGEDFSAWKHNPVEVLAPADDDQPEQNHQPLPAPRSAPRSYNASRIANAVEETRGFLMKLDPATYGRVVAPKKRQHYLDWLRDLRAWADAFERELVGGNIIVVTDEQSRAG